MHVDAEFCKLPFDNLVLVRAEAHLSELKSIWLTRATVKDRWDYSSPTAQDQEQWIALARESLVIDAATAIHAAGDQLYELPLDQNIMHEIQAIKSPAILSRILHADRALDETLLYYGIRLQCYDGRPTRVPRSHGRVVILAED